MSPVETVIFAALWMVLLSLAVLVLILYRQVEKAYRQSTGVAGGGLEPGALVQPIDVVHDGEIQSFDCASEQLTLLAFVTSDCDACTALANHLDSEDAPGVRTVLLVTGDGFRELGDVDDGRLNVRWIVSPADVKEQYRVTVVPTLYLVQDGVVLGASNDSSPDAIKALLAKSIPGSAGTDGMALAQGPS